MASGSKRHHFLPPLNGRSHDPSSPEPPPPHPDEATGDGESLLRCPVISRPEVLRRRSRRAKHLIRVLKDCYWALMEDIRVQYRDYCWNYGKSPVEDEDGGCGVLGLGFGEGDGGGGAHGCVFPGCKSKAMALTSYCCMHILSDSTQTLYKACSYVAKSGPSGPVICGKPVLRSAVPSLCHAHFQKAQKYISQALKKAGLNASCSRNQAPKFHVIVAEFVCQIQAKRRSAKRSAQDNGIDKVMNAG